MWIDFRGSKIKIFAGIKFCELRELTVFRQFSRKLILAKSAELAKLAKFSSHNAKINSLEVQVTEKISVNFVIDFSPLHSGADLELLQTSKMECFKTTVKRFLDNKFSCKALCLRRLQNPGDNHHNHRWTKYLHLKRC